ncbi:MAG: hypothetical protein WCA92_06355, partial [Terriglobales bacterium]
DGDGEAFGGLGAADELVDDGTVRAMHAVKVADTDERWAEAGWDVREFVEDLHSQFSYRRDAEAAE